MNISTIRVLKLRGSLLHLTAVLAAVAPTFIFAHSYGPDPRFTAAPADDPLACTRCHAGALNRGPGSVRIVLPGEPVYIPGVKQRIVVSVADPDQRRWGFQLTARLDSDPDQSRAGDLEPVDNHTQVICANSAPRPCGTGPAFIAHTALGTRPGTTGGASFQFDWTPPATDAGPITLYVAGNAANGNNTNTDDRIYLANVQLQPAAHSAPAITAASIVNSATLTAVPAGQNSWITIYGTNLSVTSRGWTAAELSSGSIPTSLDGVSVLITNNFALPTTRLAFIGYVSPTQINVLLPPDQVAAGTPNLRVRNTAGITEAIPLSAANTAPQLFADAGKAIASHADGTSVSTSAPAAPGETITVFASGLGATTPPLVTGIVPSQAFPLATLPSATLAGAAATVTAGSVVPGSPGLYQLRIQIPADAATGDQPLVIRLGTTNSASATIPIRR